MTTQKEIIEKVSTEILNLMEEHGTNWQKPWLSTIASGQPFNVVSKKPYQGINSFWLGMVAYSAGYQTNEWATFKQWSGKGASIIKGSKATDIFFWKPIKIDEKDASGKILKDDNGNKKTKNIWMLKAYKVFNAQQVEGYDSPAIEKPEPVEFNNQVVDALVSATGADIRHGGGSAHYAPSSDHIQMPAKEDYVGTDTSTAEEAYYSTLLHELVHWSGHKDRLDRFKSNSFFGSSEYAFEELVAETGAAILSVVTGVSPAPRADHAKYLNNWKKAIKDNPKAIFSAFTKANQAVEFLNPTAEVAKQEAA
jgi:antirestriction protein ArdC